MLEDLDRNLENYRAFFLTAKSWNSVIGKKHNSAVTNGHEWVSAKMLKALFLKYSSFVLKDRVGFNLQIDELVPHNKTLS